MVRWSIAGCVFLAACAGDDGFNFPGGGGSGSGGDGSDDGVDNPGDCTGSDFSFVGEVLVDADNCLAWSPLASGLSWHEAVSVDEAIAGGCTTHCDTDTDVDYCVQLGAVDGFSGWSLPTLETLEALATSSPIWEDLSGDLWTLESSDFDNSLAWTVDLSQPGMNILIEKNETYEARCVADAQ